MENEADVKIKEDTTSQEQVNNGEVSKELIGQPIKNIGPEKVTSIIPKKGNLEPLRPTGETLTGEHIHIVHIVIFVLALFFLFSGMWIKGKKTKF
jgi:hypothetical protein